MKKVFLFVSISFFVCSIHAQDIFKKHGFDKEILTLSKGRYEEVFTNKEVVQIGSVLLNTKTNKIVKFLDDETDETSFKAEYSSRWLSPDPLAEKYPWISPYVFCSNNPVRWVDLRGDSISLAGIQLLDQAINTNYTQTIVNDLQSQTGLTITVSANGTMSYAKDANGNPVITTTTDANGNTIQAGSATARTLMTGAMDHQDMVTVTPGRTSGVPPGTNTIGLNFKQIDGFINGTVNMDNRTLGWGMTVMHELYHTQIGGGLPDSPFNPGPVVTQMNIIRSELNTKGGNYGQRMDYYAAPLGSNMYIPFDIVSKGLISSGIIPSAPKFIRFRP